MRDLVVFLVLFAALISETFLFPGMRGVRPWVEGEALPLVRLVERNDVVFSPDEGVEEEVGPAELPSRGVARGVPLEVPEGALDSFFEGLFQRERGGAGVRVLHWGDSTIAADGVAGTVRRELQQRFGDAGPGFLPASVDTRWVYRPNIARWQRGRWVSNNITVGGLSSARYGLAGAASVASPGSSVVLGGVELEGDRERTAVFDLYYQERPGGGKITVEADGHVEEIDTSGPRIADRFHRVELDEGVELWRLSISDAEVVLYGAVLESGAPGLTWETMGVAGSSIGSMKRQSAEHLEGQVARREPTLLVYQTGGNALEYDTFVNGDGIAYARDYVEVFERMRSGAGEASCLVVGPLDQGRRVRGEVVSVDELDRMVTLQRGAAIALGCAFWDARAVMEGGFPNWMAQEPSLTWSDLIHLSEEGRELVGLAMSDAILASYEGWLSAQASLLE